MSGDHTWARWQGGVDAKLDALLTQMAAMGEDKTRVHADHERRIDSLEATRDKAIGALLAAAAVGGLTGGGVSSLINYLI